MRFISLPLPILELNDIYQGLFKPNDLTEPFPEDWDFYFFLTENSTVMNTFDSKNKTQISISGLSLYNESITIEGVGGNYLNNSLYSEYQRLFSLNYFYSGIHDEIAPIQDFIFLSQEKMYDIFNNYTLPVYGALLLNFGIKSFTILQLGLLRQLYSLPIEDIIYDENYERLDIIASEGIIYYLKENEGFLTNLSAELIIFIGLFLIFTLIVSRDIIMRYFDSQELNFIRLKKYGVNIVSFRGGVEKTFILKFLSEIWVVLLIFIIGVSTWLSLDILNDVSLFFEGLLFFGIRLLMYFSFLTVAISIVFHQEYQKISVATMFSAEKSNNIYSKHPVLKEFSNNAQTRWLIFGFNRFTIILRDFQELFVG